MKKSLVFDMDGTIVDFYSVENWLDNLKASDPTPYQIAKPLVNIELLNQILKSFQILGYKIVITSWLAQNSTKDYDQLVRRAKKGWLKKYQFPFDEIHLVKYGTNKSKCTKKNGGTQILIDDNVEVREKWTLGETVDATKNIIEELLKILLKECVDK